MQKTQLEICAADLDSVISAAAAGAPRVELCSALAEGGVTPSAGLIAASLAVPSLTVHVLIRPRGGDFVYSEGEIAVMEDDIRRCASMGVHGVVIGALRPDGTVDAEACRRLVSAAGTMNVTFHRAFDMVRDPLASLETVISLGCSRILTSGCAPTATEGAPMLRALREHARGRIIILAGGGVDPSNAAALIGSGAADELHASAKELIPSAMTFRNDSVKMGKKDADEYMRPTSSRQIISQIIKVINNI